MNVFSYHLTKLPLTAALQMMFFPIRAENTKGLIHAETMSAMILGSPIFSSSRLFSREIVVFAQWDSENDLDNFLQSNSTGKRLEKGWHVRLKFLRQWGQISRFQITNQESDQIKEISSVAAVTIARMKYFQIPRFLRWGRPVEKQVRDNTETTLTLASIRYPNIVSTFSVWKSQKAMTDMVHGHSKMPQPMRHHNAMKERERKDFHFEFSTLRFKVLSEYGVWNNKRNYTSMQTDHL